MQLLVVKRTTTRRVVSKEVGTKRRVAVEVVSNRVVSESAVITPRSKIKKTLLKMK